MTVSKIVRYRGRLDVPVLDFQWFVDKGVMISMKNKAVWQLIADSLTENIPCALLAVIHSKGSSPGRQGFKMAVTADGRMAGSIGGGIMEQNLVNEARELVNSSPKQALYKQLVHHKKAEPERRSGMICAGSQDVVTLTLDHQDLHAVDQLINTPHQTTTLLQLSPRGLQLTMSNGSHDHYVCQIDHPDQWLFKENIRHENTVYILGGGHVSLALSKALSPLDFTTVVIDNRDELLTLTQNDEADETIVMPYDQLDRVITEGAGSYVVIMTFSFPDDVAALREVIRKKMAYIGLMGSPAKIRRIFRELKKEGVPKSLCKSVRAPIGLDITSQSPEEIAISIAAQMIQIKNKGNYSPVIPDASR